MRKWFLQLVSNVKWCEESAWRFGDEFTLLIKAQHLTKRKFKTKATVTDPVLALKCCVKKGQFEVCQKYTEKHGLTCTLKQIFT